MDDGHSVAALSARYAEVMELMQLLREQVERVSALEREVCGMHDAEGVASTRRPKISGPASARR